MTEPPPPRYRVVERGRRLEVIDTWNGGRPASAPPAAAARIDAETFTTPRFLDAKGPRTIRLNYVTVQRLQNMRALLIGAGVLLLVPLLIFWPWSLVVAFGLLGQRKAIRKWATAWFDRLEADPG